MSRLSRAATVAVNEVVLLTVSAVRIQTRLTSWVTGSITARVTGQASISPAP